MMPDGFYNMDCLSGMKEFPDNYFDLAIVDPPYGSASGDEWQRFGGRGGRFEKYRQNGRTVGEVRKKIVAWDTAPPKEYFEELFRVSREQIIWGGNYFDLPPTRCFIVWEKTNIPEGFSMAQAEYAWCSFWDNAKVYKGKSCGIKGRFHPTQKPVELYEWTLQHFAQPGQRILDTHVGSGSSLIACHRFGCPFVGFEIDPEYYAKAKERLDAERAQMSIFDYIER